MEAEYKRSINHNYLILTGNCEERENSYQLQMVLENDIGEILPLEMRYIDGKIKYYFEISSKQPLSRIFYKNDISFEQAKKLLLQINQLLEHSKEYLLEERHFMLQPEFIYCDLESMEIEIPFFIEYEKEIKQSFSELAEYLLQHIDHQEEKGVFLAYQFYKITRKENFVMEEILHLMEEKNEMLPTVIKESKILPIEADEEKEKFPKYEKEKLQEMQFQELEIKKADKAMIGYLMGIVFSILLFIGGLIGIKISEYSYRESIVLMGIAAMILALTLLCLFLHKRKIGNEVPIREDVMQEDTTRKDTIQEDVTKEDAIRKEVIQENAIRKDAIRKDTIQEEMIPPYRKTKTKKESYAVEEYNGNTILLGTVTTKEEGKLRGIIEGKEVEYSLDNLPITIGKLQWYADIVIKDESISRMHAKFFEKDGMVYLEDLNSTNGTRKNGILLEANEIVKVEAGDEIQLANYKLTYC